jgi:hypothetical protein
MVISLRRCLVVLALLLLLVLAACGGGSSSDGGGSDEPGDIAGWRAQIRSTAESQLPDLASSLGAQAAPAEGRYQASGGGVSDRTFAYSVATTLTGGSATADQVAAALEDLGYDVSSTPVPNGTTSITGTRSGTTTSVTVGDDASRPLAVTITSPFVDVPDSEADTLESKVAKEPLDIA